MLIGVQRAELDNRILSALVELGWGVKASELVDHLRTAQRHVIGRLQALKRRGMVTYERDGASPSAAGIWAVSERGGQVASQVTAVPT